MTNTVSYSLLQQHELNRTNLTESGMISLFPRKDHPQMPIKYAAWPRSAVNDLKLALYALFGASDTALAKGVLEAEGRTALRHTNGKGGPGLLITSEADVLRILRNPDAYSSGRKLQKGRPKTLDAMLEADEVVQRLLAAKGVGSLAELAENAPNPPQLLH